MFSEGANGEGTAYLSSLRSFDREREKELHIPIIITDSGEPAISGTSTLTVIIGDIKDTIIRDDIKEIFVYNYLVSNSPDVPDLFVMNWNFGTGSSARHRSWTGLHRGSRRLGTSRQEILLGD